VISLAATLLAVPACAARPSARDLMAAINKPGEAPALAAIAQGADPNARDASGQTALMLAADSASSQIVRALIAHGANVNARNPHGYTALMLAAGSTCPVRARVRNIVALLLDHGANVNARSKDGSTALLCAVFPGNLDVAERLLKSGADPNAADHSGFTALGFAVSTGAYEMAQLLLEHGAHTSRGAPVLAAALAPKNRLPLVRLLVAHGADVNAGENMASDFPADKRTRGASAEDLRALNDITSTPLGAAVTQGDLALVQFLLNIGAKANTARFLGMPVLSGAVMSQVWTDDPAILNALAAHGLATTTDEWNTALRAAAGTGEPRMVKALLEHGADPNAQGTFGPAMIFAGPGEGSALMAAAAGGGHIRLKLVDMGRAHPGSDRLPDISDAEYPAVRKAALAADPATVRALAAHGADPNAANANGDTALIMAARAGNVPAVKALVDAGAKVEMTDANGMTPLMWAVQKSEDAAARVLLEAGADVNARAPNGANALSLAVANDDAAMEALIRDAGGTAPPARETVITSETLFTIQPLPLDGITALNDRGEIVGLENSSPAAPDSKPNMVLWSNGSIVDLGDGTILGLTNDGRVYLDPYAGPTASGKQPPRVVWKDGHKTAVPPDLWTAGVFSAGGATDGTDTKGTYVERDGNRIHLEVPNGAWADVRALNDHGLALGSIGAALDPVGKDPLPASFYEDRMRMVLWRNGRIAHEWKLDDFRPFALNQKGDLAGSTGKDSVARAALWKDGRIVPLPTPDGADIAGAVALNDAGDAVGESSRLRELDPDGMPVSRAVLWRDGKAIMLDDAIAAGTGWRLRSAEGINNRGEIVGTGLLNGVERCYLLRPVALGDRPGMRSDAGRER
jgi:ankyrin repeat protein